MPSMPPIARARQQWEQGRAHAAAGRWAQAANAFAEASRIAPQDAVYALNLANAQVKQGLWVEASRVAGRVLREDPRNGLACTLWSHAESELGRHDAIVRELRRLDPTREGGVELHEALGRALQALGRHRDAISAYMDALARQVQRADLHYQLGVCFNELGLKAEAAQCYGTALALGLGRHALKVQALLAYARRESGAWSAAETALDAARATLHALTADADVPATPFVHVVLSADPDEQRRAARSAARDLARSRTPLPAAAIAPLDGRRLRIGYVSSDFHTHATALLMAGLLESHDRSRFELTLYSHGEDDRSPMRARLVAGSEHFVDLCGLNDLDAARRIRADGIDLLVDLKGWTAGGRLGIFLHRPAPVQASWLGYPGTSGVDAIDYLIGDPVVTPLDHAADFHECIAQLPDCYQPNDRQRPRPEPTPRSALGLAEDAVVLCGFNQPFKLSAPVFDVWCRVLRQVPSAVLWLLEWNAQVRPQLTAEAARRGIDPSRLVWAPRVDPQAHLARLAAADLYLDAWPCNGHTTVSDALWSGVPVLSFPGRSFASRVAASLVAAAGLPDAVARDVADYEARAVAWSRDPVARRSLRERLVASRDTCSLFDPARRARDLEALYRRMLERCAAGLPPAALPAEPWPATLPGEAPIAR